MSFLGLNLRIRRKKISWKSRESLVEARERDLNQREADLLKRCL